MNWKEEWKEGKWRAAEGEKHNQQPVISPAANEGAAEEQPFAPFHSANHLLL